MLLRTKLQLLPTVSFSSSAMEYTTSPAAFLMTTSPMESSPAIYQRWIPTKDSSSVAEKRPEKATQEPFVSETFRPNTWAAGVLPVSLGIAAIFLNL